MGQNRTLRCLFAGVPPPTVTWLMNGRTLVDSPRIIVSNSSGVSNINIQSFRSSDAGLYTCVITNVAATVNSTFLLEIESKCILVNSHTVVRFCLLAILVLSFEIFYSPASLLEVRANLHKTFLYSLVLFHLL